MQAGNEGRWSQEIAAAITFAIVPYLVVRAAITRAVPVTVLTGFLGSGKSMLLNRILNGNHGLRVAVLVNDFGSINIDADLVVDIENKGDVINFTNGCVC
jgi:Ni2+-binding GTPase involved in maturation of urease and hydrogenase